MKSYNQHCAMARALDVIGDRWTLLIVRELMVSDGCRYTDLQAALPGIASNLLANRLKEMEANGIVRRRQVPPPIATTLFHLTDRGRALEPIVAALGWWGMPLLERKPDQASFKSRVLKLPLQLYLTARSPHAPPTKLVLRTGDEPLTLTVDGKGAIVQTGVDANAQLTLSGNPNDLLGLLFRRLSIADALKAGVRLDGDTKALDRIVLKTDAPPAPGLPDSEF